MMRYIYIIIIWLLPAFAFAQPYPDTITIISADLPYTIPNNFTAYRISPSIGQSFRINSATNGIIVNSKHDIEIFGNYTGSTPGEYASLNFCSGGGDSYYGILLASSYNILIKNLNIYAGMGALDDDNDSGNACIRVTGSTRNVTIRNGGLYPDGLDGKGFNQIVDAGYNSYNLRFTGVNYYQYSNKFTRRDYYMASLMKFELSHIVEEPDYHIQIDSCIFDRSIHVAVAITGSQVPTDSGALVHIFDNEFHQQGTNTRYTTFTDNATQSLGDNFAMSFIGIRRGSQIHDNIIYGDNVDGSYGGSGILIQGAHGWPDDPVEFYDNRMILRSGRHIALSALKQATQGFYIRSLDNVNSNQHLHVYRNNIQIYVDTSQATTSTGRVAEGIRLLCDTLSHDIYLVNNHVSINRSDSAAGLGNGSGESELITSGFTIAKMDDNRFTNQVYSYGNYYGSYKAPLRYGSNRESSYGANDTYLQGDTLVSYVDLDTTVWFETNGSYVGHSINNINLDCTLLGYANAADVVFAGGSSVDSLGKSVEFWKTLQLLVLGSNGQPVGSSEVWASNAYDTKFLGTTDFQGWIRVPRKTRYEYQDYITGDAYNPGDSLSFEPRTVTVYAPDFSDTVQIVMTLMTQAIDTVQFDSEVGTTPPFGTKIMMMRRQAAGDAAFVGPPAQ